MSSTPTKTRSVSGASGTDYFYTGQREEIELGLYYHVACWYDPYLNHWIQPDTIVPDPYNSQDWDRYNNVRNNPVNNTDPSRHAIVCASDIGNGCAGFGPHRIINAGYDPENTDSLLRSFLESRPDYQVEMDPLTYGQNEEFIVQAALFQVELEKPKYEPLLANQYTPVVTSAMSVLATDAQYHSLAIPHPTQPITFGVSYLLGYARGL